MKTIDRQAFIDAAYNTDNFASEGLPVETPSGKSPCAGDTYSGWRLDPQSERVQLGRLCTNYIFDLDEAQEAARRRRCPARRSSSTTLTAHRPAGFPPTYYTRAEIFLGMIESAGIWKQNRDAHRLPHGVELGDVTASPRASSSAPHGARTPPSPTLARPCSSSLQLCRWLLLRWRRHAGRPHG